MPPTWLLYRNVAHALYRGGAHLKLARCGALLTGDSVRLAPPNAVQCTDCIGTLDRTQPVMIKRQPTRYGLAARHTISPYRLHHLRASLYDRYPDLDIWAELIGGAVLHEDYVYDFNDQGRMICHLDIFWKED